jgi:hypothetical protein
MVRQTPRPPAAHRRPLEAMVTVPSLETDIECGSVRIVTRAPYDYPGIADLIAAIKATCRAHAVPIEDLAKALVK